MHKFLCDKRQKCFERTDHPIFFSSSALPYLHQAKKTYIFNPSGIDLEEMLTKNRLSDATKYPQLSPFKD